MPRGQQAWHSCGCRWPSTVLLRNVQTHVCQSPAGARLQEKEQTACWQGLTPAASRLRTPGGWGLPCSAERRAGHSRRARFCYWLCSFGENSLSLFGPVSSLLSEREAVPSSEGH